MTDFVWQEFTVTIKGRIRVESDATFYDGDKDVPLPTASAAVDVLAHDAWVQVIEPSDDVFGVDVEDVTVTTITA